MAVSVKFAEPRSHAVQKVRNAAASDAGSPVVIQDAELGRSAGSLVRPDALPSSLRVAPRSAGERRF